MTDIFNFKAFSYKVLPKSSDVPARIIKIANIYKDNNATCLSVLTEEKFFLGDMFDMSLIKSDKKLNLPILC